MTVHDSLESAGTVDAAYRGRNLLAQLCAWLARRRGWPVWVDPTDASWPILYIGTPEGQISYHVAVSEVTNFLAELPRRVGWWDGHTVEEAEGRLLRTLDRGRSDRTYGGAGVTALERIRQARARLTAMETTALARLIREAEASQACRPAIDADALGRHIPPTASDLGERIVLELAREELAERSKQQ